MSDIKHGRAVVVFCHQQERWVGPARRVVVNGVTQWKAPTFATYTAAKKYAEKMDAEIAAIQQANK